MEKCPKKKLLDQVRDVIRLKHYSIRTEKAYVNWIRRYILFQELNVRRLKMFEKNILTMSHQHVSRITFYVSRISAQSND